jgi:NADPH-dependent 2,4-dienoyl-CoA reductase/sulfur reductase-like enzyme
MSIVSIRGSGELADAYDLVVIGAGPAGLGAATTAAVFGVGTLLVDENHGPGGQIYRSVTRAATQDRARLGEDYWHGRVVADAFARSDASYAAGATVWTVAKDTAGGAAGYQVGVSVSGAARLIRARQIVVATGALERPFPIPGWTLPGVMTAGAAQIALKSAGLVPSGKVVIAGTGPLLFLLTAQLVDAGADIVAVLDTTPRENWTRALPGAVDFLRSPYLRKGLKLLRAIRRTRVVRRVSAIEAMGDGRLREVLWRGGSAEGRIPADLLLLHQGIVPNINLASAIGCALSWDDEQLTFRPNVDEWFESSCSGVGVAGDGAGIGGAEAAFLQGRIAALGVAFRLGTIDTAVRDREAAPLRRALARTQRGRRFLDALYRPAKTFRVPPNAETVVCRCEEITAGQIRETVGLGVAGPNQMKAFLRCGMGPCQGRLCGLTVTELIADERGTTPDQVGHYRLRAPVKPLRLSELAALPHTEAAHIAVVGDAAEFERPTASHALKQD